MLPFGTRAKYEDTNHYKYKKNEKIDEIKAKVKRLKNEREQKKKLQDAIKNQKYAQGQTVMKRMHEDIMRDKGIVLSPGQPSPAIMPNGIASAPRINMGYKVPRKFTLESLSKMNYGDFTVPQQNNQYEDEFKPEDVLDSDDEIDEEIENMYQFKENATVAHNSVLDLQSNKQNSPMLPGSQKHRYQEHSSSIGYQPPAYKNTPSNKNIYTSGPVTGGKRRNKDLIVNKSMINQGRLAQPNARKLKGTTTRTRGSSVHHSAINVLKGGRSKSKPKNIYGAKGNRNKSLKNVQSDYSPNRNRIRDKLKIGNQAIKRTQNYDLKNKRNQQQKMNNVLRMHNYE